MNTAKIQDIEFRLFVKAMLWRHGYDFRHYAKASLKRRVLALMQTAGCKNIGELLPRLLHEDGFLKFALSNLSVPVTEMFRDPHVFLALRRDVLPLLASYPRINIWQAGCATGEESLSLAILLKEEGLLHKAQIYATDINDVALEKAEEGIYPDAAVELGARNYLQAGGKERFEDYFVSTHGFSRVNSELRERISYAHHDLVCDGVFCEVSLVVCRNVLIYFDHELQRRVMSRFSESLARGGFLCLGTRESLHSAGAEAQFRGVNEECRIFKKSGVCA